MCGGKLTDILELEIEKELISDLITACTGNKYK